MGRVEWCKGMVKMTICRGKGKEKAREGCCRQRNELKRGIDERGGDCGRQQSKDRVLEG